MSENWEISWKDYYQILQVHTSTEPEFITSMYKKLLEKYHPDHNPGKERWATEKSKEINEAYEILSNTEKRTKYNSAYLERVSKSDSNPFNRTTPPVERKPEVYPEKNQFRSSNRTAPPIKPKPEVYPEENPIRGLPSETKTYQILKVTDEHMNEFICGTTPACQEKDVEVLAKCEIYRYDSIGDIRGLAYPTGKQDGFHNKVELLDSHITIFNVNEESRKIKENKAPSEAEKAKIMWVLNAELKRLDEDLKSLNENLNSDRNGLPGDVIFGQSLKEQINGIRTIIAKIRDNKPLSEGEKDLTIWHLNRQWESVYLSYCGLINSFPYKTKKSSDHYVGEKTGNSTG